MEDGKDLTEEVKDMKKYGKMLKNEYNKLRSNPKYYAGKMRQVIPWFKGKILRIPGQDAGIETQEGADAFKEGAKFLDKQKPLEKLEYNKGLGNIARDFLKEIQKTDPEKIDEIDMDKFIDKYGSYTGGFRRAIDFGSSNPCMALMSLFCSDGDETREQREAILDPDVKLIAVASGTHESYRNCNVILTCTQFEPKKGIKDPFPEQIPDETIEKNEGEEGNDEEEGGDEILEEGVKSIKKSSKIISKNGKKFKITTITKEKEDGTSETYTTKENI